jgi:hypothetical protein
VGVVREDEAQVGPAQDGLAEKGSSRKLGFRIEVFSETELPINGLLGK